MPMHTAQWRRTGQALAVIVLLLASLAPTHPLYAAEEPLLNIYNWSDYIDPELIREFERESGIKVNYDIYDSSEIVDTKLLTGHSGYDIVVHSASFSARLIPIGVYQSVDYGRLENWHHIDSDLLAKIRRYFGEDIAGVPYMWGTTGFAYNREMVLERMPDAPLDSAAMLFDPAVVSRFADCGVTLLDDPTSVIPIAMLYLGLPANSVEPEHLAKVEQLLKAVRPYIKYFSSTKMLLDLPSREVCIAMAWSGDYAVATTRAAEAGVDIDLAYTIPKEGAIDWYDVMYIPADAPHPDNAYRFLDFMLRPEVVARASNYIGYANANRDALPLVDEVLSSDPAIYPDQETMKRLEPSVVLPPKLERRRSRTWTKIKTGL
ncbi:MAG: polyamine ABC transporter substrate-binding protein [Halieaceae bacterium]|jgi:putrescine transport system substrate-binding protein|nr:polyamine ABC transporter substrate-binding protein [Halieaceae bacterium]